MFIQNVSKTERRAHLFAYIYDSIFTLHSLFTYILLEMLLKTLKLCLNSLCDPKSNDLLHSTFIIIFGGIDAMCTRILNRYLFQIYPLLIPHRFRNL